MKKSKKVLVSVVACMVVCAISIPAIAANMQKTTVSMEQVVYTRNSGLNNTILDKKVVYPNELEENTKDIELAEEAAGVEGNGIAAENTAATDTTGNGTDAVLADVADTGVNDTAASPVCPYYVDNNGDGVCDYCAHGGACGNYVDANWDGACDYCTHNGSGHCGSYSDSNGDGYCDNYVSTGSGSSSSGSGHHGSHHGEHHW